MPGLAGLALALAEGFICWCCCGCRTVHIGADTGAEADAAELRGLREPARGFAICLVTIPGNLMG